MDGERSGLFFEAMRVVREMREASNGMFPRFVVWENVANALSSNKGEDFRKVLQEFVNITESEVFIPKPKGWEKYGEILGEECAVSWGVFSPEFFGLLQSRSRVFVVVDFGRPTNGEFVSQPVTLFGDFEQSQKTWEEHIGRVGRVVAEENQGMRVFKARSHSADYRGPMDCFATITCKGSENLICDKHGRLRKLSNTELARLQGFPEDYISSVKYSENNVDLDFWRQVFEEDKHIRKLTKSKTDKQIVSWLTGECAKDEVAKLWGNGVALPVVIHVLRKIIEHEKQEKLET